MRGNYHTLYQRLLGKSRRGNLSIFYPATAKIYPSYSRFIKIFISKISENQDTRMLRSFLVKSTRALVEKNSKNTPSIKENP